MKNKILMAEPIFIGLDNNIEIIRFLKKGFESLEKEFQLFLDKESNVKEKEKNYSWSYNETALLGLFQSSLVRNDRNIISLIEYSVYNKINEFIGRADLYIKDSTNNLRYIIEAKRYPPCNSQKMADYFINSKVVFNDLVETKEQLHKYLIAEKDYIDYGIVICFQLARKADKNYVYLNEWHKYETNLNGQFNTSNLKNYFETFFYDALEELTLHIWGTVYKI